MLRETRKERKKFENPSCSEQPGRSRPVWPGCDTNFRYLSIYNNENLPNAFKVCQSWLKLSQVLNRYPLKIPKDCPSGQILPNLVTLVATFFFYFFSSLFDSDIWKETNLSISANDGRETFIVCNNIGLEKNPCTINRGRSCKTFLIRDAGNREVGVIWCNW